jgi:hypothetical protein
LPMTFRLASEVGFCTGTTRFVLFEWRMEAKGLPPEELKAFYAPRPVQPVVRCPLGGWAPHYPGAADRHCPVRGVLRWCRPTAG